MHTIPLVNPSLPFLFVIVFDLDLKPEVKTPEWNLSPRSFLYAQNPNRVSSYQQTGVPSLPCIQPRRSVDDDRCVPGTGGAVRRRATAALLRLLPTRPAEPQVRLVPRSIGRTLRLRYRRRRVVHPRRQGPALALLRRDRLRLRPRPGEGPRPGGAGPGVQPHPPHRVAASTPARRCSCPTAASRSRAPRRRASAPAA